MALNNGTHLILDYTYHEGWIEAKKAANLVSLPYIRIRTVFSTLHQAADEFLVQIRKARDTAIIFQYPYRQFFFFFFRNI